MQTTAAEPIKAVSSKTFIPFGGKLKEELPWYPQEACGEWPHQASALSLGESNVLKYGISYPLRTGLDTSEESDFIESVTFTPTSTLTELQLGNRSCKKEYSSEHIQDPVRKIEEAYLSRGVCLLSEGPLGGPSFLKGLYRPLTSYSTGVGIKAVVKTYFPRDLEEDPSSCVRDAYICLVEKSGISLYADGKNESHVSYMPEFQIDRVISSNYGLLVVPNRSFNVATEDSKFLYILTHPIKQVSRIWCKSQPGSDFFEFDATLEKLLWCEKDLCIFWSLKNDKFVLRRLVRLEKKDAIHCSTLNASIYYTNQESDGGSPFTPAGGSSMYSPLGRFPPRTSAMRVNREGNTVYYWPSFDFSDTSGPGLSVGFYPPHYCVYDDPEYYLNHMFEIELNPNGKWIEPQKFQMVRSSGSSSEDQEGIIALWYKMKTNLYVYSVNLNSGIKISHFAIKGVKDFVCSSISPSTENKNGNGIINMIVILSVENTLKIGWLDSNFNLVVSVKLIHSLDKPISSLDSFLFCDTLICSLKNGEKGLILLKNITKTGLISTCVSKMVQVLPSALVAKLVASYMAGEEFETFDQEWNQFVRVVNSVILSEHQENSRSRVGFCIYKAMDGLRQNLKASGSSGDCVERLLSLSNSIVAHTKSLFSMDTTLTGSLFQTFLQLLIHPKPTSSPCFSTLPKVMQVLLDSPDNLKSLVELSKLKASEKCFAPVLEILIADVFKRNQESVQFDWPPLVLKNVQREDYLCGVPDPSDVLQKQLQQLNNSITNEPYSMTKEIKENGEEDLPWTTHILKMRVFSEDRRLEEVCRLLDSAFPLLIDIEQRAEMSDHEFVEEQEKHLLQLLQITFSAPVGRTAFTLRSEVKNFANLTNVIQLPKLCTTGKCATRGTTIELNDGDVMNSSWPSFHNSVASSASVRFSDQPTDAWFAYNKAKTNEGPEQAGMILGFGLNGILTAMPPTLRHEYLAKENSFTSMAMLLGLSANLAGTGDIATWKVISLHIGAMLPACTTELEIPRLATLVAPCALGLLFMGTQNSHIAKVLLGEISKRYNPLSVFGGAGANNSQNNQNSAEVNGSIADREAHSLCAGFGLGFVNLGKCKNGSGSIDADGFDGILRRFVVGGPKPSACNDDEDEIYCQYGQVVPSLWEEYRCCHIEEGDNVNVDVTTPSAIVAVALTYLKSGNEAVLKWLSPPTTLHLLDCVRPDILMLRSLASILVYESLENVTVEWLELNLMPKALTDSALKKPEDLSRLDHESINQAWASIVCGYCLGIGIRLAGTSHQISRETLWHYLEVFLSISSPDSQISEYFPKNFLESSICTLVTSISLILAGSGDIPVLRLCRYMQTKVAATQITSSSNTYGMEMSIAMATGILFLGGGRYSLSNDDRSIAVLLASVFPKWPINANDNRYHLQALRHLYLLAAQPRLILTKPMAFPTPLKFTIEYLNGQIVESKVPVLLPPFHLIKKIKFREPEFLPIEFNLPKDLPYLKKIVEGDGVINLVHKPVTGMKCGFLKQMMWRDCRVFHSTFLDDDEIPDDEGSEIKELNMLSRMAESAGLRHIIPSLLSLKNADTSKEDWVYQIRILYWWITLTKKNEQKKSCLPVQLLGLFLDKAGTDFKIFEPINT